MAWFKGIVAGVLMFIGGFFGHPPVAQNGSDLSHLSIDQVMQQIGCRDETDCVSVCQTGVAQAACAQLEGLMKEQGTWSSTSETVASEKRRAANGGSGQSVGGNSVSAPKAAQPAGINGFNGEEHTVAYAGDGTSVNAGALPDCPAGDTAFFDHAPLDSGQLSGIIPLGNMNGAHILPNQADHVYVYTNSSGESTALAPGKATLLQVVTQVDQTHLEGNKVMVFFSPCKSVMFAYQMDALSPAIQAAIAGLTPIAVQNGGAIMHNTIYRTDIPLEGGEALGTFTGDFDFAAADVRTLSLKFLNQEAATGMVGDSYLHAVCPLDYFAEPLRSTLNAALTIKNAGTNGIPACGAVMQDKAGTAQGNWYEQGMNMRNGLVESGLLAIVHSNTNPAEGAVSFGDDLVSNQWMGTQIFFAPTGSGYVNREPSEITADGHAYCFDGPAGAGGTGSEDHLVVEMTNATTLKAEYGDGPCAAVPALSAKALSYAR